MPPEVRVIGITGMPEFKDGDDLAGPMMDSAEAQGTPILDGDILVVTQKIISTVEGKVVRISDTFLHTFHTFHSLLNTEFILIYQPTIK